MPVPEVYINCLRVRCRKSAAEQDIMRRSARNPTHRASKSLNSVVLKRCVFKTIVKLLDQHAVKMDFEKLNTKLQSTSVATNHPQTKDITMQ